MRAILLHPAVNGKNMENNVKYSGGILKNTYSYSYILQRNDLRPLNLLGGFFCGLLRPGLSMCLCGTATLRRTRTEKEANRKYGMGLQ